MTLTIPVSLTTFRAIANLIAIAVAKAVTQRQKILVFGGAYHSSVLAFPTTESQSPLNVPHEFIIGPYNDIQYVQSLQQDPMITSDLAAVLVEQMQGAGGCHAASPEFLQALRKLTNSSKAILTSRLHPRRLSTISRYKPGYDDFRKVLSWWV
ncbi:uncharacterized protein DFL_006560 [Arthrobotrys flagrans]|uniref:Uncharacterized protein n=1 Tax=Arthrobotrys flagrans TaxID=97331 RepID=A0A436ZTP5_ARTFL|nr:hypothetical protein DFL_006560 [Arthrobotrys flagrans]